MKTVSFVLMMLLTIVVFLPLSSAIVKIKVDPLTSTFLNLFDTPSSYSGQGGNCVVVNVGEDGLEFGPCGSGGENPFDQSLNTTDDVVFNSLNVTENITAESYFGDGSELTGIIHTVDTNRTDAEINTLIDNKVIQAFIENLGFFTGNHTGIWTNVSGTATYEGDANVTGDIYSNSYQVLSYQRTVNVKNVTMVAVI